MPTITLSWWRYGTSRQRKLCFVRVPLLQWNKHPTQFNLKKRRRKLKSAIMHCEKSLTSQIGFCTIRIWTLNTPCFYREIGKIAIVKIFRLNSFIKQSFQWQFYKKKRKFLFAHRLFFNENKIILAHCALNLSSCNAKQEINLTLPNSKNE